MCNVTEVSGMDKKDYVFDFERLKKATMLMLTLHFRDTHKSVKLF